MNFNEKVDNVCRLLCMQGVDCTYNLRVCYIFFGVVFDNLMHRHDASFFVE